ncbi:MAG: penicillin-binding protein 1C [Chlorobi bacterium]|nr:penicillin-binding protein 1C [Chlorobiota bacterium]
MILISGYIFILPSSLFDEPVSTVIRDKNGELLGAHIADDGQYRFPETDSITYKFQKAITTFEDKRFYYHPGVDLLSLIRAVYQNFKARKIVSGGSTITMQVIRLSRKGKARTVREKIKEIILATRLEFSYSKNEILKMYASNAPFGGNVVGIDAAAWRWFGTSADKLSWAQTATLAVLPNSPALIHPGRNRNALRKKRNRLLKKLFDKEIINQETYELATDEDVPEITKRFPNTAQHLLMRIYTEKKHISRTTVDADIQKKVNQIAKKHFARLSGNRIYNSAILVLDVQTGAVIAYMGNYSGNSGNNSEKVDIITSVRSTGSILKPFLYASMLSEGVILPNTLVFDIPTRIGGYTPKNYGRSYDGAVPAKEALARSLNIPAVRMLRKYGQEKFYHKLKEIGLTSLNYPPDHYGLSLILGGCEGSLWDICGAYASMARSLNNYEKYAYQYKKSDYHPPAFDLNKIEKKDKNGEYEQRSYFSASAIWFTFKAMLDVERPDDESNWRMFQSSEPIAWKTGTSFGFRDAWAIGITPKYVVGVWAGNADGEGRPGIVGVKAAAPVLFDVFDILSDADAWFTMPETDMVHADICKESGYSASVNCNNIIDELIPASGTGTDACPFHKIIHLDKSEKFRVNASCEDLDNIITKSWFILPPAVENYYKRKNAFYKYLPPYRSDCKGNTDDEKNMELIYPFKDTKIYVPVDLDGKLGKTVFEAAHRNKNAVIFWYVDDKLVGQTKGIHQIELSPKRGEHILTLIDQNGEKIVKKFEILNKRRK